GRVRGCADTWPGSGTTGAPRDTCDRSTGGCRRRPWVQGRRTLARIQRSNKSGSELTCSRVRTTTSFSRRKEFNDESRTASPARSRDLRIRVPVLLEVSVQTDLSARRWIRYA